MFEINNLYRLDFLKDGKWEQADGMIDVIPNEFKIRAVKENICNLLEGNDLIEYSIVNLVNKERMVLNNEGLTLDNDIIKEVLILLRETLTRIKMNEQQCRRDEVKYTTKDLTSFLVSHIVYDEYLEKVYNLNIMEVFIDESCS